MAAALVEMLTAATAELVTVFAKPPATFNPPAIVIARVERVTFSLAALNVDDVSLPLMAIGPLDDDEGVSDLAETIRLAIRADPTLRGTVQAAWPYEQRNWRPVNVAGADLLAVEVAVSIQM